jgi:hypothetical protein
MGIGDGQDRAGCHKRIRKASDYVVVCHESLLRAAVRNQFHNVCACSGGMQQLCLGVLVLLAVGVEAVPQEVL